MRKVLAFALLLSLTLPAACGGSSDSRDPAPPAQTSAVLVLNAQNVPPDLRPLIPLAEQWGIGDDLQRVAKVDGATPAQRAGLRRAVTPYQARITQWLDSFGSGLMSEEAVAFMYMQLAIEEMTGLP
jgi:hypothetical protein